MDALSAITYRFASFELRPGEHVLLRDGHRVSLSPKAFDLLKLLVVHHGRVVDKPHMLEALWPDTYVDEANLSVQIAAVRKALGLPGEKFIETIAKRGYRFVAPVETVSEDDSPGPTKPGAYVFYKRANQLAYETTQLEQARDLYEAALRQDPGFVAAWARLGRCYRVIGKFGASGSDAQACFVQAERAFERALALDPGSSLAHSLYAQLEVDTGKAHDAMLRLLSLVERRGRAADLYAGLVHALRFCGLLDYSVAAHRKARALEPAIPTSVHHTWWMKGEYLNALSETYGDIGYMPGLALASAGQTRDAIAALRWRERESADLKTAPYMTSLRALLEDKRDESIAALDQASVLQLDGEAMYYIARSYAKLGLHERFHSAMERVVDGGFFCYDTYLADPWLDTVRRDARVAALLARAHSGMLRARAAFENARGAQFLSAT